MKKILNEDFVKIIISVILFIASLLFKNNNIVSTILLVLSYIIVSLEIYLNAFKNIKKGELFDENTLMIIATLGAFYIHEYTEAVMVMLLFSVGEYLSDMAVSKSKEKITNLMNLKETTAIMKNGQKVDVNEVKINDIIIVNAGMCIPLDGVVVKGESSVDTSSLTGESLPRQIKPKMPVLSGTIVLDGLLEIKVTSIYQNSTAKRIMDIIESSPKSKADSEKFITKFSKIYTPIVILIAFLVVLIPSLLGYSFHIWLYRSLELLVISCPCALVLSVPLSYFCGIGICSKKGILVKGSKKLEKLNYIDTFIFDKTGTITKGLFKVSKVCPHNCTKEELLKLAAIAEKNSNHPIATAIKNACHIENEEKIEKYQEKSGKGITCFYNNKKLIVGSNKLMAENKVKSDIHENDYGTIIHISYDSKYLGHIIINDEIKKESKNTIKQLKELGLKNIVLLSGDTEENVKNVAKSICADTYISEALPEKKIEVLKSYGDNVAFVGDGINDAPVIKLASIGFAMGGIGSAAAVEASDIVISSDNLLSIIDAINISKKVKNVVIFNTAFACLFKLTMLILAILGLTPIWASVLADVGVTLIAVLNSIRILHQK